MLATILLRQQEVTELMVENADGDMDDGEMEDWGKKDLGWVRRMTIFPSVKNVTFD